MGMLAETTTIQQLSTVDVNDFDKDTLKKLKPYFGLELSGSSANDREQWFVNLLALAQHSLGISHCVQHNAMARAGMEIGFQNCELPEFYKNAWTDTIGCWSNNKSLDTLTIENNLVSGNKHWISNLHQADYGIFRIPHNNSEAYVLFDFSNPACSKQHSPSQLGLEIARAGMLTVNAYQIPNGYILGYRTAADNEPGLSFISNLHDYAFITNYLGLIQALFSQLENYFHNKQSAPRFALDQLRLELSALHMLWQDNLPSVHVQNYTDHFWHRRNTQYVKSKTVLIELVNLILQTTDNSWTENQGQSTQRFRDALVFCMHQQSLYKNLQDKHFLP